MDKRMDGRTPQGGHLDGDLLCDFAEGVLDAPARADAEAHIRDCAACRLELEAMQGYFQAMSSLEPAKAPTGFLAGVHARLPKPSPWKKALGLLRPRAVPLQIAFLTLLGITALTAYLHQRGGLLSDSSPMLTLPEAEPDAPAPETANSDAPISMSPAPQEPPPPVQVPSEAASPPVRARSSSSQRVKEPAHGYAQSIRKDRTGAKGSREDQPTAMEGDAKREESERPASPPSPPSSTKAEIATAPAPALAKRSVPAKEMASAMGALPEWTVRMRKAGDTTAMLAGLKAMGMEILPAPGPAHELRMRSSLKAETQAYLERYGETGWRGDIGSPKPGKPVSILLRILPAGN